MIDHSTTDTKTRRLCTRLVSLDRSPKTELFSKPDAVKAMNKEWKRLWDKKVWDHDGVREWSDVAREAASQGKEIHMGRLFGICVQKGSELPDGDARSISTVWLLVAITF